MQNAPQDERARGIFEALERQYPDSGTVLRYDSPWELLVAVILSAQSTDTTVNRVTRDLFQKYRTLPDYAGADELEFQTDVHSTGFFRNKTKSVIGSARMILADFGGHVPRTMEEMLTLPGVARKTANVVLGNAYGVVEGIAVDTHVKRLAHRLGFTEQTNPDKIEKDLMGLFPKDRWFQLTYLLIDHGRAVCTARRPDCATCVVNQMCPAAFTF